MTDNIPSPNEEHRDLRAELLQAIAEGEQYERGEITLSTITVDPPNVASVETQRKIEDLFNLGAAS
ncbi:MAG: hypothetical protein FGM32_00465 [Candidatus Kapabacteria bacterium]|nr:hypothetical protein [Candidatus Kapabacteria bacterium]